MALTWPDNNPNPPWWQDIQSSLDNVLSDFDTCLTAIELQLQNTYGKNTNSWNSLSMELVRVANRLECVLHLADRRSKDAIAMGKYVPRKNSEYQIIDVQNRSARVKTLLEKAMSDIQKRLNQQQLPHFFHTTYRNTSPSCVDLQL